MKYRPIAFSAEMAQAIAEGRKTQTRRVITLPASGGGRRVPYAPWEIEEDGVLLAQDEYGEYHKFVEAVPCPYGRIGDRLWVREAHKRWCPNGWWHVRYRDGTMRRLPVGWDEGSDYLSPEDAGCHDESQVTWHPPIFMPRWASRSLLEIADVWMERVQDITEADAKAEGVQAIAADNMPRIPLGLLQCVNQHMSREFFTLGFWQIWDVLYSTDSTKGWNANPWVWVIEFRRVDA